MPDSFSLLRGTGPSLPCCYELSQLHCHSHGLLLLSYLCRINGWKILLTASAGSNSPPFRLPCLASEPLWRTIFGTISFLPLVQTLGVVLLLGLNGVPPCPYLSKEVG